MSIDLKNAYFHFPNPPRILEVSKLPGAGKGIPVPSFTLWAKYSPEVTIRARLRNWG
jgi:hypothetical protein